MGRKKNSEKIEHTIDPDVVVQEIQSGSNPNKEYVVLRSKKTYTFKSAIPGMLFYTKDDNTAGSFQGHETREDITEKERKMLINSDIYKKGFLVEVLSEDDDLAKTVIPNALSDQYMAVFIKKNQQDTRAIEHWIDSMDSEITLNRVKAVLIDLKMPNSLQNYCDYRLKRLEEEYLESQKAPIDALENKGEK